MASISDLTWSNNFAAARKPFQTDIETAFDSVQTHINDTLGDNLQQLALDAYPSGYAFDSDGNKNFTGFDLFDKQTITDTDTSGDVTLSGTGSWTDVDATNAAIVFTPVLLAGDFRVTFQFNVESVTSNATNELDCRFRLTDSTTNSDYIAKVHLVTGVTATTNTSPVSVSYDFDSLASSSQTVKLQFFLTTTTANVAKVLANSTFPIDMKVCKI